MVRREALPLTSAFMLCMSPYFTPDAVGTGRRWGIRKDPGMVTANAIRRQRTSPLGADMVRALMLCTEEICDGNMSLASDRLRTRSQTHYPVLLFTFTFRHFVIKDEIFFYNGDVLPRAALQTAHFQAWRHFSSFLFLHAYIATCRLTFQIRALFL